MNKVYIVFYCISGDSHVVDVCGSMEKAQDELEDKIRPEYYRIEEHVVK